MCIHASHFLVLIFQQMNNQFKQGIAIPVFDETIAGHIEVCFCRSILLCCGQRKPLISFFILQYAVEKNVINPQCCLSFGVFAVQRFFGAMLQQFGVGGSGSFVVVVCCPEKR